MIGAGLGAAGGAVGGGAAAGSVGGAAAGGSGMSGMMSAGGGGGGTKGPRYQDPGMNWQMLNMLQQQSAMSQKQDKGFYGHMTVDKAKKGHCVNIIGRGD